MKKLLIAFLFLLMLVSCAGQKTATEQITQVTDDPIMIANASYLDVISGYDALLESFIPYIDIVAEKNPLLFKDIQYSVSKIRDKRIEIKEYLMLGKDVDLDNLRSIIGTLSISIAQAIDERNEK